MNAPETSWLTPVREPRSPARVPAALALLTELFGRLHAAGIRYCHWKSSAHLSASLEGAADLDVLVHRQDARRLARVLADVPFKPFRIRPGREYPGIEDYLGFDVDTGRLSHLHVHYQLTLGEKFLKGYRLPWEEVVLATRILDASLGLYVIDPNLEALLLVTRAAIKLRARDYVLAAAGYRYVRGGTLRELRWLTRRVDDDRLYALARPLVGERAAALLSRIVATPAPSIRQLRAFQRSVHPSLRHYRMYGAVAALRRRWAREWGWVWIALANRARGLRARSTRTAPQGGLAVCVTGPQPGATAVAQQLIAWLAPQVAVVPALGTHRWAEARRARARGLVVVADRLDTGPVADRPDLVIALRDPVDGRHPSRVTPGVEPRMIDLDMSAAPAAVLLEAKRAVWESI